MSSIPEPDVSENVVGCEADQRGSERVTGIYRRVDVELTTNTPNSDTGCSHTKNEKNGQLSFDWLAGTFLPDSGVSVERAKQLLTPSGASVDDWVLLERAGLGYQQCVERGGIRIYYAGAAGMGVHVSLSGEAVRRLEADFNLYTEEAWQMWVANMLDSGLRFSRVDLASDDIGDEGVLDMEVIKGATKRRELTATVRKFRRMTEYEDELHGEGYMKEQTGDEGETLYYGRRSSNYFVRIYNRGAKLGESFHWIRVEQVLAGKNADWFARQFVHLGFSMFAGLLASNLDFKAPSEGDTNKSRWERTAWWSGFLGACEKMRLRFCRPVAKGLEVVLKWIDRQGAPSLAVIFDAMYLDCEARGLNYAKVKRAFVDGLAERGRSRYKTKHRKMLGEFVPSLAWGGLFS